MKQNKSLEQKFNLVEAMNDAIDNMITEIKKPITSDITGSARKAELQSIKETALACSELIRKRDELQELIDDSLEEAGMKRGSKLNQLKGDVKVSFSKNEEDFGAGFAEEFAK
jgi:hypothetical protein